ncbi:MAG TPA: chorismate synthase, partial [Spirochaetota bacterium]|nr:chorismate synthase [Spirochaetota bacterium]
MKIIISGPKGCGKSTVGKRIAEEIGVSFYETDEMIESMFADKHGTRKTCRMIVREFGEEHFREWETAAIEKIALLDWCVVATGGGTMLLPINRALLRRDSIIVLLKASIDVLWERMQITGLPPFLQGDDAYHNYCQRVMKVYEATEHISDVAVEVTHDNEATVHKEIIEQISFVMGQWMFAPNTFGQVLRITTFGESHGAAVGVVIDGLKPDIPIDENDIQKQLDKRKPGQSTISTQRKEADHVAIVSGIFEGKTTGTPVCMIVYNKDKDSMA